MTLCKNSIYVTENKKCCNALTWREKMAGLEAGNGELSVTAPRYSVAGSRGAEANKSGSCSGVTS